MASLNLRDKCSINSDIDTNAFVGVKAVEGNICIHFPLGFRLSESDNDIRKDILLLLSVLSKHTDKMNSEIDYRNTFNKVDMPLQAYIFVIADYFSRGYYKETEKIDTISKRGKINWSKTIRQQKGYIQDNDVYYLDFIIGRNRINENELITQIHKYCVYESFMKIGWLFTNNMPEKAQIAFNKKLFMNIVKKKEAETFNDQNKRLFRYLYAILSSLGDDGMVTDYTYGTYRFEYVWESMIDTVYGVKSKDKYFPKTQWRLGDKVHKNASLEPDTIMINNNKIYVLDAKYYKYGCSGIAAHLPESTSINKQITYGEYIAESEKFTDAAGNHYKVYNAFIMPYDKDGSVFNTGNNICSVGVAEGDWKSSGQAKSYEKIAGVLMDVKTLMNRTANNRDCINELAELIEECVCDYT